MPNKDDQDRNRSVSGENQIANEFLEDEVTIFDLDK